MQRSYNFCVKTSLRLLLQHDYLKLFRVRVDLTNLSKQCKSQKAEIVFCVENVLLLNIVSIIMQWASVNVLFQKRYKTVIFNESASSNRKLIFIFFLVVYLSLTLDSPLDSHLVLKASTQKIT